MDWAQILVIILAVFLAIFLILGIILTIIMIRVTQQIKSITDKAERTVNGIEAIIVSVGKITSPMALGKLIYDQVKKAKKRAEKKGDRDE